MLRVERNGDIAIWTLDRPEARNALSHALMTRLIDEIAHAQDDKTLRAVVLTGAGKAFASGGDLRELRDASTSADAEKLSDLGRAVCDGIAELEVPVIAAIAGPAIGGGAELAVACDLRIAELRAKICFKHVRMGLTTSWGTMPRLVSLVGRSRAARLLFTAHDVSAADAQAIGLVDQLSDNGGSVAAAVAWAMDIAQGSPRAVAEMKALLREASANEKLRAMEREKFVATWTSADHAEAMEAYFGSRAAVWKARG